MVKEMKMIQPNLCDYSDAYILVTGDITAANGNANTRVAFKNCSPFRRCVTHTNDEHVGTTENVDIIMPMYNLLEYSANYADSFGSLWQFKRDELQIGIAILEVSVDSSLSFKYKANLLESPAANGVLKNATMAVP